MTIAKQLETSYGGKWRAVRDRGEWNWHYECTDGRVVRCYAECILGWDGYKDDEFATVYIDQHGKRYCVGKNSLLTTSRR